MNESLYSEIEILKNELAHSQVVIEALKRHQKASRSLNSLNQGAYEIMIQLESIVRLRTAELEKSRAEIAAANAVLEDAIRERTKSLSEAVKEISLLSEIGRSVNFSLDLKQILNDTMLKILNVTGLKGGGFFLVDYGSDELFSAGGWNVSEEFHETTKRMKIGAGISGAVVETGKTILIEDLQASSLLSAASKAVSLKDGIKSQLSIPLIYKNVVVGVMNIIAGYDQKIDVNDIPLFELVGGQIAVAIANAKLFQETRQHLSELEALNKTTALISSNLNPDVLFKVITEEASKVFTVDAVSIMLTDESGEKLSIKSAKGLSDKYVRKQIISVDFAEKGLHTNKHDPVFSYDLRAKPFGNIDLILDEGIVSNLAAPFIKNDRMIGILNLYSKENPRNFTTHEINLARAFADQATIAIVNARQYEESERWARHLAFIQKLGSDLNKFLDVKEIAQKVVIELGNVIDTDDCRLYILSPNSIDLIPMAHWFQVDDYKIDDIGVLKTEIGVGITGLTAQNGKPEIVPDANKHPGAITIPGTTDIDESMLLAPIVFENKVKGIISLSKLGLNQFTEGHLRLLKIIADETAIALENAALYQEKSLQLSEIQRLKDFNQAIVEGLEEGVMLEDDRGHITYINPKMEELSGFSYREILGKHWSELFSHKSYDLALEETKKRRFGLSSRYEALIVHKSGDEKPMFISARPIFSDGKLVSVLSAFSDIGELKKLEMKMVKNARLSALGEMSGGVAHDFNNVLGAILGRVQLIQRRISDPEVAEGLKVIEKAALDGAETVKRIQNFTRTRTGEQFTAIDLNEIIEDAISITRSRWKEEMEAKGLVIRIDKDLQSLPTTAGNPGELREVFTNLIFNAIDAMPDGGFIRFTSFCKNNNIYISVEDNGSGIDKELIDKIFDPFFTTKGVKGNGLGLSVSYGIITRHQGEIIVKSTVGHGSVFTIKIPVVQSYYVIPAPKEKPERKPCSLKIVVIDDDAALRNLLAEILEISGHFVLKAATGMEGLEIVKRENPHIVFTDLGMPSMSGWDVVKEVRLLFPDKPVVMVTGWGEQLDKEKLKKFGVDTIIAKPFQIDKINETVRSLIDKSRVQLENA